MVLLSKVEGTDILKNCLDTGPHITFDNALPSTQTTETLGG